MWPIRLRTDQIELRPLRRRDRFRWMELRERNREWLKPWEATSPVPESGLFSFGGMVAGINREARAGRSYSFALYFAGRMAGQVTIGGVAMGAARTAHIGYWIDHRLGGRGLMTQAVALATDFCLNELGLHRIEINIRPENARSRRVAEKCGYREEGLRAAFLHIDGQWRDHICYVMLAESAPVGGVLRSLQQQH